MSTSTLPNLTSTLPNFPLSHHVLRFPINREVSSPFERLIGKTLHKDVISVLHCSPATKPDISAQLVAYAVDAQIEIHQASRDQDENASAMYGFYKAYTPLSDLTISYACKENTHPSELMARLHIRLPLLPLSLCVLGETSGTRVQRMLEF